MDHIIGVENQGFAIMATVMNGERLIAAQGASRQVMGLGLGRGQVRVQGRVQVSVRV